MCLTTTETFQELFGNGGDFSYLLLRNLSIFGRDQRSDLLNALTHPDDHRLGPYVVAYSRESLVEVIEQRGLPQKLGVLAGIVLQDQRREGFRAAQPAAQTNKLGELFAM